MRLFNVLLHLFPRSFQLEYAQEMRHAFEGRRAESPGGLGRLAFWIETIADLVHNAARVHGDILRQDLRFTVRALGRAPGFALTASVVTALGVGATTAAFSITDHVLFRPLSFKEPDRLVRLWLDQGGYGHSELSPANYRDWKANSRSFADMGAFGSRAVNLSGDGHPERLEGYWLTSDVFRLLGVGPVLGRVFGSDDDLPGALPSVVLSYQLWRSRFGGDETAISRRILLEGSPHILVGVMPPTFHFPNRDTSLWISRAFTDPDFADRGDHYVYAVGRLKAGVSFEEARADMRLVAAQLERAYPDENAHMSATVDRFRDTLSAESRLLPLALLGASICVLLIACANLTNLLLARAMVRRKELAVRVSLGAGRERLVRQLLTESLVLALLGGILGVILAVSALPVLARLAPNSLPIAEMPSIDLRLLAFTLVLTAGTGIAFGVLPAVGLGRTAGVAGLQEGARAGVGGRRGRARSALVAAEVSASVILLVSCGLLLRALWRVETVDPGFRGEGVLTMRTALPLPRYGVTANRVRFYSDVLAEVRALPGVSSAAYASGLPLVVRGGIWGVAIPGQVQDPSALPLASARFVTPGFLQTLGIPLRAGREIRETDTRDAPAVAMVSDSLARRHWPGENPIGRLIRFGPAGERTIVGIVGDIRVRGLERTSEPQVYLSYQQVADNSIIGHTPKDLVIRAGADPQRLLPLIRAIVSRADPEQPISDVRLLKDILHGETAPRRTQVSVLGAFAAIAFLLAAVGLHGVLSYAVSSRAQEIGVRMALGARTADILRMVMRETLRMAGIGLLLGLCLAYAAGRGMQTLLAGLSAGDLPTFAATALLAMLMTVAGSVIPAYRAVRVNPTTVMRTE